MHEKLVLVHTVRPLLDVFETLCAELLPDVSLMHVLDEPLLERIRLRKSLAPEDAAQLYNIATVAEQIGAQAVLVTCSTITPCVDEVRLRVRIPIIKIDAAMIERAVQIGTKIGVVATNPTTLEPTRQLLDAEANQAGKVIETQRLLVPDAFDALMRHDTTLHDQLVRETILDLSARVDVIVLAQASMGRVLAILPETERPVPVLSSPHLALAQVKTALAASPSTRSHDPME